MNRLERKNDLLVKLGMLFRPLLELINSAHLEDADTRTRVLARFASESLDFVVEVREFAESEPGHKYEVESQRLALATQGIVSALATTDGADLNELIPSNLQKARKAIEAIPVSLDAAIMGPVSPYKTYCSLRDIVASASTDIVLVDAYLDHTVFHRFLTAAESDPRVTLTTQEVKSANVRDQQRWAEFLDISRLYAVEKGPARYELSVLTSGLHDRWLLIDRTRLYQLGGSVKDAGTKHFTITQSRVDAGIVNTIMTLVASGTEYFGRNVAKHL